MSATVKDALGQKGTAPYGRPLKVKIVPRNEPVSYKSKDGEEKQCLNCAVCDGDTVIKITVYDNTMFSRFENIGNTVVLRDIIKKSDHGGCSFVVTKTTKMFMSSSITVEENLIIQAERLLNPPPAPVINLQNALRSPQKQRLSVSGKVVQEDAVCTVSVKGDEVPIKAIYLADETMDTCRVTLWRKMSSVNVRPGDYVTITNVVTNTYKNETSLSGTSQTTVEV